MPVVRERGGRRRTASSSSDCGQLQSPPRPRFFAVDFEPNDTDGNDLACQASSSGEVPPLQQCCSPKCSILSELDPISPDSELVRMICSNDKCPISPFMHASCFTAFEEQMLSFLRGMSRAKNWSEKQRRQNLWTKKGYDLIFKFSTCRCNRGGLRRDLAYGGGVGVAGGGAGDGTDKGKRKRKRSASGEKMAVPIRAGNGAVRARNSRLGSRTHNDSTSSENGGVVSSAPTVLTSLSGMGGGMPGAHMQPFAHRTDYAIFERHVPRHLVNSYHIKMEDDGYGAGDDTRSFVLSSLAHHRTSFVKCVLCSSKMTVYDQFPLLDGTFFLSPVRLNGSALAVESKDSPSYMMAVCLRCLVGSNKVTCTYCLTPWNGNAHQIGTMYSYDLFAACPCCPASLQCNKCKHPLADPKHLTLSFSQLSSKHKCGNCSANDFHFIKPISRFQVSVEIK